MVESTDMKYDIEQTALGFWQPGANLFMEALLSITGAEGAKIEARGGRVWKGGLPLVKRLGVRLQGMGRSPSCPRF